MQPRGGGPFPTTRWSLVRTASGQTTEARVALETLCTAYWMPVYVFIRRIRDPTTAQDLTQAFFTWLIEAQPFRHARADRGRFRAFLLTSVRNFVADLGDKDRAIKRGGSAIRVPVAAADEEVRLGSARADSLTPEELFEQRWARAVLDAAISRVEQHQSQLGRGAMFHQLLPLIGGEESTSYAAIAKERGMSEGAIRMAAHRLRRQLATAIRDIVADTVESPDDVDDEVKYLKRILQH